MNLYGWFYDASLLNNRALYRNFHSAGMELLP